MIAQDDELSVDAGQANARNVIGRNAVDSNAPDSRFLDHEASSHNAVSPTVPGSNPLDDDPDYGPDPFPDRVRPINIPPLGNIIGRSRSTPTSGQSQAAPPPFEDQPSSPDGQWAGFDEPQAEMTEDMLNLLRASAPPIPDGAINSVEDLLEVVHLLPVVAIFRRMKHLKASRIRRMFNSRKFREHMELRRQLAWEKATTEAAVVVPAAVDKLYRLTMCDKPETARKSCMSLMRLGKGPKAGGRKSEKAGNDNVGDRKTADRKTVQIEAAAADGAAAVPPTAPVPVQRARGRAVPFGSARCRG